MMLRFGNRRPAVVSTARTPTTVRRPLSRSISILSATTATTATPSISARATVIMPWWWSSSLLSSKQPIARVSTTSSAGSVSSLPPLRMPSSTNSGPTAAAAAAAAGTAPLNNRSATSGSTTPQPPPPAPPSAPPSGTASSASTKQSQQYEFPVFRYDMTGNYTLERTTFAQLKQLSGVAARDLLILESAGGRIRSAPSILPRQQCILLSVSHVKAIVFADSVLLLDVHRPVVQNFAEHMRVSLARENETRGVGEETQYFEFRVIECVLKFVCQKYSRRMSCFHPVIHSIIRQMNDTEDSAMIGDQGGNTMLSFGSFATATSASFDTSSLHRLLPLKNSLAALERATTELLGAITAILKSDDDMLDMFLTEKKQRGGELPPREAHAELELLLENYHRDVLTLTQDAEYLRKTIQSGQDLMNIALDTYRNRMVRINAQMAMATVGMGTGLSLFSMFGMNLRTGLEDVHPVVFWLIGLSGYVFAGGAWLWLHRWLARPPSRRAAQSLFSFAGTNSTRPTLSDGSVDDEGGAVTAAATAPPIRNRPPITVRDMRGVRAAMNKMGDIQDIVLSHVMGGGAVVSTASAVGGSGVGAFGANEYYSGGGPYSTQSTSAPSAGVARLSWAEFRAILEKACGRPISGDEMDAIFRVYDRNGDNVMELDEVKHFLADQHSMQFATSDSSRSSGPGMFGRGPGATGGGLGSIPPLGGRDPNPAGTGSSSGNTGVASIDDDGPVLRR